MKPTRLSFIFSLLCIFCLFGACHRRNEGKERVLAQRAAWEKSLVDSLEAINRQSDSIRDEIKSLSAQLESILPDFDYVCNPREVEGYYIAKAWKSSYPLSSTGLVARLSQGESLELIAALAGGGHFDRIRVEADGISALSSVVPYDQALNYRMKGINIVCFSDSAARDCARLIAEAPSGSVRIVFLNAGKVSDSFSYPAGSQSVMRSTWRLFFVRNLMRHDERMIPLLAKKGAALNDILNSTIQP